MENSFDVIVIGVGSMGSSACYVLADRGYKVLGLEQFDIAHEFGSHAGQSRIIRKAYFEHSDYVPLLTRAYENWTSLEEATGQHIYFQTGLLYFGNPGHPIMKGVRRSASLYDIEIEHLSASSSRFQQFVLPKNFEGVYEPGAGFVMPEKAVRLYAALAKDKGAEIHVDEKVREWTKDGDGILVRTDRSNYRCSKLVITAGAWAGKLIPGFQNKLNVTRQFVAWINPKNENSFKLGSFPCWLIADDERPGAYYGFPILPTDRFGPPSGLKLAHHHPAEETDPDKVNRNPTAADEENLRYVLEKYFPGVFESFLSTKVCLYTNSPDEDFIIDTLPGFGNVIIACGFSGHGFKFVSVVGEILADLSIDGKAKLPIEFLSLKRFG